MTDEPTAIDVQIGTGFHTGLARFDVHEFWRSNESGRLKAAYVAFIHEVNRLVEAAGSDPVFGEPKNKSDDPLPGWLTEHYPSARVIHAAKDQRETEGIRIKADEIWLVPFFEEAQRNLEATGTFEIMVEAGTKPRLEDA